MPPTPRIAALIVAAGTGTRAGGELPKQYQPIAGKPMLRYAVDALASHPAITAIQVVIHPDHAAFYEETFTKEPATGSRPPLAGDRIRPLTDSRGWPEHTTQPPSQICQDRFDLPPAGGEPERTPKLLPPIHGGAARSDSVRAGLAALVPTKPDYVLIHDAARPFLSHRVIDNIIAALTAPPPAEHEFYRTEEVGVVPALPMHDTVRRMEGERWSEIAREGLLRIQTPQAFPFESIKKILASGAASTDEAAVWLATGYRLVYVEGEEELRKVTTANDIKWAEAHVKTFAPTRTAVGSGYDVHQLVPSETGHMRIGGIDIASKMKSHGHSDADVVLHAVVDALLGALAEGDIGQHFPPGDDRWKGADSAIFVTETLKKIRARGGKIQHIDVTIICEAPKIAPHRDAIRARLAQLLEIPATYVSIKATTTEKLGFTGRGEGIAAQAVATLQLPEGT